VECILFGDRQYLFVLQMHRDAGREKELDKDGWAVADRQRDKKAKNRSKLDDLRRVEIHDVPTGKVEARKIICRALDRALEAVELPQDPQTGFLAKAEPSGAPTQVHSAALRPQAFQLEGTKAVIGPPSKQWHGVEFFREWRINVLVGQDNRGQAASAGSRNDLTTGIGVVAEILTQAGISKYETQENGSSLP
jgi:hypothetical protein